MIPPSTQKLIKHVLKPLYDYGMISSDAWKELMEKIADDSEKTKSESWCANTNGSGLHKWNLSARRIPLPVAPTHGIAEGGAH